MKIKSLVSGIFFKFFIGLLVLSFAFFGVSSFLLGGSNSWVVKVDGKKISYNQLQNVMKIEREVILQNSGNNPKALEYVESKQFMSDVLGRIVNKAIVEKLANNFGVDASRRLILEAIAKDEQFRNNSKFDRTAFQNFLAQSGYDEDSYVRAVQNEIVATMIISSLSSVSPVDGAITQRIALMKNEKRVADIVVISKNNIGSIPAPKKEDLMAIYEKTKQKYAIPELRKSAYLSFNKKDLIKNVEVGEKEIAAEYEANKGNYKLEEKRDFYHILFSEEADAKKFLEEFKKSAEKDRAKNFIEIAKRLENRSEKSLILAGISKSSLIPQIGNTAFSLANNEYSQILSSPLGYHLLLVKDIRKGDFMPLAQVKESIKTQLLAKKEENLLQNKISEIEALLISSNSLETAAKKVGGNVKYTPKINDKGLDSKGATIKETEAFDDFVKNIFAAKKDQASQLFFAKNGDIAYALKVEEIEKSRERTFDELKAIIENIYTEEQKLARLKELANRIADEIKKDPSKAARIAAANNLKLEKNKEFPRVYFVDFQGQKIPYSNNFLEELFTLKIGQSTTPFATNNEFNIGIITKIIDAKLNEADIAAAKKETANLYRSELLQTFNEFLQKKYPIKVNEKFLKQLEEEKK